MPIEMDAGEVSMAIVVLTGYELVWQKVGSYEESDMIGKTTRFALSTDSAKIIEVRVVADCIDDTFGVVFDFTYVLGDMMLFYQADTPDGLITGAEHKSGDVWNYKERIEMEDITLFEMNIYFKAATESVYRLVLIDGSTSVTFNLVTS
jgi:hypothetical protein